MSAHNIALGFLVLIVIGLIVGLVVVIHHKKDNCDNDGSNNNGDDNSNSENNPLPPLSPPLIPLPPTNDYGCPFNITTCGTGAIIPSDYACTDTKDSSGNTYTSLGSGAAGIPMYFSQTTNQAVNLGSASQNSNSYPELTTTSHTSGINVVSDCLNACTSDPNCIAAYYNSMHKVCNTYSTSDTNGNPIGVSGIYFQGKQSNNPYGAWYINDANDTTSS